MDKLKSLFSKEKPFEQEKTSNEARFDPLILTTATLLISIAMADGKISIEEKQAFVRILRKTYALDEVEAEALFEAAILREAEAVDIFRFTHDLKKSLELEDRIKLVEDLWTMVLCDNELDALEDNFVWRASELLNVDSRERMLAKKRAADKIAAEIKS